MLADSIARVVGHHVRKFCAHCEEVPVAAPGTCCKGEFRGRCRAKRCVCGALVVGWLCCRTCERALPVEACDFRVPLPDDVGKNGGFLKATTVEGVVDLQTGNVWLTPASFTRVTNSTRGTWGSSTNDARQILGDSVRGVVLRETGWSGRVNLIGMVHKLGKFPGGVGLEVDTAARGYGGRGILDVKGASLGSSLGKHPAPTVEVLVDGCTDVLRLIVDLTERLSRGSANRSPGAQTPHEALDTIREKMIELFLGPLTPSGHYLPLHLDEESHQIARLTGRDHLARRTLNDWPPSTFPPIATDTAEQPGRADDAAQ